MRKFYVDMVYFQSYYFELKKHYSSFFKKVFIFQEIYFQVKVLKTFKIFSDSHMKTCRSLVRRAIMKIRCTIF